MPTLPAHASDERRFLRAIRNHGEFRKNLTDLSMTSDLDVFDENVASVARCWFRLGKEHLADARAAETSGHHRAVYSRAYYAAYSASRAVRYYVYGFVSLRGDDHQKAPDLPDDFPDAGKWASLITSLYEHRLRADYDNWTNTGAEHSFTPRDCIPHADRFIAECHQYIIQKFGVRL